MSSMTRTLADATAHSGFACGSDPDAMFPPADSEIAGQPNAAEARALETCSGCGQLSACRAQALAAELPVGVAGGMTAADRRAARAVALGTPRVRATESPAPPLPDQRPAASALDRRSATLEPRVAALIAEHAPGADPARVRALALGQDPAPRSATRHEVALAALARLAEQQSVGSTARALGVDGNQVRRWRDRQEAGEPLVQGEGAGRNPYRHDPETGKFAALSSVPSPRTPAAPTRGEPTPTEPTPTERVAELGDEEIGDEDDEPEPAARRDGGGDVLDGRIAAVLACKVDDDVRAAVDPVVVRRLVEASGPAAASRWETALAAAVCFERGDTLVAVVRRLGEPLREVRAWRARYDRAVPLIPGGQGVGTQPLPRPARLVGHQLAAPRPTRPTGHSVAGHDVAGHDVEGRGAERGAA